MTDPANRAQPAGRAQPADTPVRPGPPGELPGAEDLAAPSGGLWLRMKADPQYAPEHLALEAVRRLGPAAAYWADRMRAIHPGIYPDTLAEWAIKRFTNHARLSGAVSGAAGLPGAVVDVGVLAWTQARMVLHIAAAYGVDPTHPDRATDLLVLQRVHKVAESARLALGVAAGRERAEVLLAQTGGASVGQVMLRLGAKLAQMAGVRAAKRMFAKVVPGASIILGTWANSTATTELARRASGLYRRPWPPAIAGYPAAGGGPFPLPGGPVSGGSAGGGQPAAGGGPFPLPGGPVSGGSVGGGQPAAGDGPFPRPGGPAPGEPAGGR